nr:N-6 DNA methylase [Alkalibacterium sp. 20]
MVLKRNRPTSDVLIIDASKGFEKSGNNNKLRPCDIKKIADTVKSRASVEKYSALVSKETISENSYNLNISRYVDSIKPAESWDIHATMFGGIPIKEVDQLLEYWEVFPELKEAIFEKISDQYVVIKHDDIEAAITSHESLGNYKQVIFNEFSSLYDELKNDLIEGILDVSVEQEQEKISFTFSQE